MTYEEYERQAIAQLVKQLRTEGLKHRGTPLGGLLQWAAMHIEELHKEPESEGTTT